MTRINRYTSEIKVTLSPRKVDEGVKYYEQIVLYGESGWVIGHCHIDDLFPKGTRTRGDSKLYDRLWKEGEEVEAELTFSMEAGDG